MGFEQGAGAESGRSESAADYMATLETIRGALEANDSTAIDLEGGGRVYAALLSPLSEYGAKEGDDHLVLTIDESPVDDADAARSYMLTLYHLAEDRTETNPMEWNEFRTDFTRADLDNYNEDAGEEWRTILEAASHCGWFSEWEAWFRVEDDAANASEFEAETLMARAIKKWRTAERKKQWETDS